MTAKEYLQQAKEIDRRVQLDKEKIKEMQSSLYGRAVNYENDGSQRTFHGNGTESALLRVLEYEERLNEEINSLTAKRIEIENAIAAVPDELRREVLTRRYLLFQDWKKIIADMHYSERRIYQLHSLALESIAVNCS